MISARKAKHVDVTTMFTNSYANTPLGQSERANYLSYFIKGVTSGYKVLKVVISGNKRVNGVTRDDRGGLQEVSRSQRWLQSVIRGCRGLQI